MKNTLKIDFENSRIVMDRTFAKNVQYRFFCKMISQKSTSFGKYKFGMFFIRF